MNSTGKTILAVTVCLAALAAAGFAIWYVVKDNDEPQATPQPAEPDEPAEPEINPTVEIGDLTLEEFGDEVIEDYVIINGHLVRKDDLPDDYKA